ncbi:hypothetical protein HPB50_019860 [Hyalomma asiaticum]|uniref:Uncharacterized protein n=1 Tax=Hyalomma asiaticum TaxID=266040 RepID=A0ACB7RJS3_HYAAI|nr:hypothetical protein HPB50_019860 [Hyalomma asiaticum]
MTPSTLSRSHVATPSLPMLCPAGTRVCTSSRRGEGDSGTTGRPPNVGRNVASALLIPYSSDCKRTLLLRALSVVELCEVYLNRDRGAENEDVKRVKL